MTLVTGLTVIGFSSIFAETVVVETDPQLSVKVTWNNASEFTTAVGFCAEEEESVALPLSTVQL